MTSRPGAWHSAATFQWPARCGAKDHKAGRDKPDQACFSAFQRGLIVAQPQDQEYTHPVTGSCSSEPGHLSRRRRRSVKRLLEPLKEADDAI